MRKKNVEKRRKKEKRNKRKNSWRKRALRKMHEFKTVKQACLLSKVRWWGPWTLILSRVILLLMLLMSLPWLMKLLCQRELSTIPMFISLIQDLYLRLLVFSRPKSRFLLQSRCSLSLRKFSLPKKCKVTCFTYFLGLGFSLRLWFGARSLCHRHHQCLLHLSNFSRL